MISCFFYSIVVISIHPIGFSLAIIQHMRYWTDTFLELVIIF